MLKITTDVENGIRIRVNLFGSLTGDYTAEVAKALSRNGSEESIVTLDLSNVTFVDRHAMEFLSRVKSNTVSIENIPSYVMRWIAQEDQNRSSS